MTILYGSKQEEEGYFSTASVDWFIHSSMYSFWFHARTINHKYSAWQAVSLFLFHSISANDFRAETTSYSVPGFFTYRMMRKAVAKKMKRSVAIAGSEPFIVPAADGMSASARLATWDDHMQHTYTYRNWGQINVLIQVQWIDLTSETRFSTQFLIISYHNISSSSEKHIIVVVSYLLSSEGRRRAQCSRHYGSWCNSRSNITLSDILASLRSSHHSGSLLHLAYCNPASNSATSST